MSSLDDKAFYKIFNKSKEFVNTELTLKNDIDDLADESIIQKTSHGSNVDKLFETSIVKTEEFYSVEPKYYENNHNIYENVFDKSLFVKSEETQFSEEQCSTLISENTNKFMQKILMLPIVVLTRSDENENHHEKDHNNVLKSHSKLSVLTNNKSAIQCSLLNKRKLRTNEMMREILKQIPIVVLTRSDENANNLGNVQPNVLKLHSKLKDNINTKSAAQCNLLIKAKPHVGMKYEFTGKKPNSSKARNKKICCVCLKEFKNKYRLKRHMLIHSNDKDYSCKYCFKSFKRRSCVTRHLLTHKQNKCYACDVCNKSFTVREYLNRHMQLHLKKRYKCNECGNKYKDRRTLKCHLARHSINNELFLCDLCGKTFLEKRFLRKHFLRNSHLKTRRKYKINKINYMT